jgi:hypothetical protein
VTVGAACGSFTDCQGCASQVGCGWCAATLRCEISQGEGSAQSPCARPDFKTWTGSCDGFCASHNGSCTDCASQYGCGWCASAPDVQCLEAGSDWSQPAAASCAYADWSFTPSYCEPE